MPTAPTTRGQTSVSFQEFQANAKKRESCVQFYLQSLPLESTLPSGPGAEREPSSSCALCYSGRAQAEAPV